MDTYRVARDAVLRRRCLIAAAQSQERLRRFEGGCEPRPIRIEPNVWLGFDCVILPGVTVGEGSIAGARSVVNTDVPPYSVVAGNPARVIRRLTPR